MEAPKSQPDAQKQNLTASSGHREYEFIVEKDRRVGSKRGREMSLVETEKLMLIKQPYGTVYIE